MPVFEIKNSGGSSTVRYSPNVKMRKCLSHCRLHSLVISYFSKIIYQRYNKNKFFKTTWHRYFHNHHVLEQRTHDQNVVTTKLSGQTQDSNETWHLEIHYQLHFKYMEITWFFRELTLNYEYNFKWCSSLTRLSTYFRIRIR